MFTAEPERLIITKKTTEGAVISFAPPVFLLHSKLTVAAPPAGKPHARRQLNQFFIQEKGETD